VLLDGFIHLHVPPRLLWRASRPFDADTRQVATLAECGEHMSALNPFLAAPANCTFDLA